MNELCLREHYKKNNALQTVTCINIAHEEIREAGIHHPLAGWLQADLGVSRPGGLEVTLPEIQCS